MLGTRVTSGPRHQNPRASPHPASFKVVALNSGHPRLRALWRTRPWMSTRDLDKECQTICPKVWAVVIRKGVYLEDGAAVTFGRGQWNLSTYGLPMGIRR